MIFENNTSAELDAEFFSGWLKKMDEDVAVAFVLSGISLDRQKMLEAFEVACQVMHIRALDKDEKLRQILGTKDKLPLGLDALTSESIKQDTEDFVSRIDKLIKDVLESNSKKKDSEEDK